MYPQSLDPTPADALPTALPAAPRRSIAGRLFWNSRDRRLRAGWRLLAQAAILVGLLAIEASTLNHPLHVVFDGADPAVKELVGPVMMGSATLLSIWIASRWLDRRTLAQRGLAWDRQTALDVLMGILIGIGMQASIVLLAWTVGGAEFQFEGFAARPAGPGPMSVAALAVVLFLVVGLVEELLSRGYQITNLMEGFDGRISKTGSAALAVALTAALFGALHLGNPNATWLAAGSIVCAGVTLGLAYIWTGNLALPMGLHFGWNFAEGNLLGFPVSGALAPDSLWRVTLRGDPLFTGGNFGPEGGWIGFPAMALGLLLILLWVVRSRGGIAIRIPAYTAPTNTAPTHQPRSSALSAAPPTARSEPPPSPPAPLP